MNASVASDGYVGASAQAMGAATSQGWAYAAIEVTEVHELRADDGREVYYTHIWQQLNNYPCAQK